MMTIRKKILASVLTGLLFFGMFTCNVMAQAYTYTVTMYAGNQGIFIDKNGVSVSNHNTVVTQTEDKIVISGLGLGDEVAFTAQADVELTSPKYYVQGIRLAGRDNDTVAASVFIVEGDQDYVVAYGIKGSQVSYTVNYHDEYGREILPSESFYGNVGDKPVVACKYVDGYLSQASGLTKTLKENAAENVLTFIYKPIPGPTEETVITTITQEEYIDIPGGTNIVSGGTNGTAGGGTLPDGTGNGDADADIENEEIVGNEDDAGNGNDEGTDNQEGSEGSGNTGNNETLNDDLIVDLDEEEVPLANVDGQTTEPQDFSMVKYLVFIGAAIIVLAILLGISVVRKKRDNQTEEA